LQSYDPPVPQQNLLVPVGHVHRTWQKRKTSLQVARHPQLAGRKGRPQFSAQCLYTEEHDGQDPAKTLLPKLTGIAMATMPMKKVRSQIERMTCASLGSFSIEAYRTEH
jgi:hypothetical protein